jgi:hypothetical protein
MGPTQERIVQTGIGALIAVVTVLAVQRGTIALYATGVIGPLIATIQLRRRATVRERDRGLLYTPLTMALLTTLVALVTLR